MSMDKITDFEVGSVGQIDQDDGSTLVTIELIGDTWQLVHADINPGEDSEDRSIEFTFRKPPPKD